MGATKKNTPRPSSSPGDVSAREIEFPKERAAPSVVLRSSWRVLAALAAPGGGEQGVKLIENKQAHS
jgi:hypothetical protein